MKNKTLLALICAVILLAAVMFTVTKLTGSPLPSGSEKSTASSSDSSSEYSLDFSFDEPASNEKPQTSSVSGASATKYEPVYPITIASETVKQPVTLHYLVPEEYRSVYFEILGGLKKYEKEISFSSPVNEDAFLHALIYVRDLNPELFFIDWSMYNYKTTPDDKVADVDFQFFFEDVSERAVSLEEKVGSVVAEANKYPNLFERELFVHDYLVNNTVYLVDNGDTGTAYGALINGKARCEGYARAFQLIMLRLGVPTFSVIGMADGERHMWNAVDLYGECYFTDVTFDDNSAETEKTSYRENEIGHSCFNIPSEIISKTHSISESGSKDRYGAYQNLILPECNSFEFNYYRIRGLMVENSEQFKYILEKNSSEKRAAVFFKGEMPSTEKLQADFQDFFEQLYSTGGYSIYFSPSDSPVYKRNVFEIRWTIE